MISCIKPIHSARQFRKWSNIQIAYVLLLSLFHYPVFFKVIFFLFITMFTFPDEIWNCLFIRNLAHSHASQWNGILWISIICSFNCVDWTSLKTTFHIWHHIERDISLWFDIRKESINGNYHLNRQKKVKWYSSKIASIDYEISALTSCDI